MDSPFDAILSGRMRDDVCTELFAKNATYSILGRLVGMDGPWYQMKEGVWFGNVRSVQDVFMLKDQVAAVRFTKCDPAEWAATT